MADKTFLMGHLEMPFELIDVIESLPAKGTGGMEKDEVSVFAELSIFDMFLILCLIIE